MKNPILLSLCVVALSAAFAVAGDGKETYDKNCAKCHGADGKGATPMGKKLGLKDLSFAKRQQELKDEAIAKAIKEGVKEGGKTLMKGTEGLSEDQVKDLVAYVRKLKS